MVVAGLNRASGAAMHQARIAKANKMKAIASNPDDNVKIKVKTKSGEQELTLGEIKEIRAAKGTDGKTDLEAANEVLHSQGHNWDLMPKKGESTGWLWFLKKSPATNENPLANFDLAPYDNQNVDAAKAERILQNASRSFLGWSSMRRYNKSNPQKPASNTSKTSQSGTTPTSTSAKSNTTPQATQTTSTSASTLPPVPYNKQGGTLHTKRSKFESLQEYLKTKNS